MIRKYEHINYVKSSLEEIIIDVLLIIATYLDVHDLNFLCLSSRTMLNRLARVLDEDVKKAFSKNASKLYDKIINCSAILHMRISAQNANRYIYIDQSRMNQTLIRFLEKLYYNYVLKMSGAFSRNDVMETKTLDQYENSGVIDDIQAYTFHFISSQTDLNDIHCLFYSASNILFFENYKGFTVEYKQKINAEKNYKYNSEIYKILYNDKYIYIKMNYYDNLDANNNVNLLDILACEDDCIIVFTKEVTRVYDYDSIVKYLFRYIIQ